ncbi:MAG: GrpB family protein [Candidatus Thermoplasmatota archaeon]|nr:GrpB family protein [Candidatus Thermoplasmatota archaeon]
MSKKKIKLVEYDDSWAKNFRRLKNIYRDSLGDLLIEVEHVGSTAIPGLCAKPNLDIDLVIGSYSSFREVKDALFELGYEYEGDFGIEGREAFRRKDGKVPWDGSELREHPHNLYVCPEDSRELKRHLAFRDHLRENEESRKRYAELKRRLAKKYRDDRESYTEGKTKFIERVLEDIM